MKKKIFILISIIAIISIGTIFTVKAFSKEENSKKEEIKGEENVFVSDKVTDDCIEEVTETNSSEEIVSPNSLLLLKKYYKECGHTINEYAELPQELVNMTEEELQKEYPSWEVIGFTGSEITLYKELEGKCGEHYILKIEDGKIVVYKINENGEEVVFEQTDIGAEFLTETDLIKIQNGFEIYGEEELNKVIEDFE